MNNQTLNKQNIRVYFGSTASEAPSGIFMANFDTYSGEFTAAARVSSSVRPGFIVIHPNGKTLYATEADRRVAKTPDGSVSSYRIQPDGSLKNINNQPAGGVGPCHLSIDPTETYLLVANYRGGSCAILKIQQNGALSEPLSIHQHTGFSLHPERQTCAHTHSFNCDLSGHFALAADLGTDKIFVYLLDKRTGHLIPNDPPHIKTNPGSGPRHLRFHPTGKYLYATMELDNTIRVYAYDEKRGLLEEIQHIPMLPEGYNEESTASEIIVSKDGRFVYAGNRGHNSIAIFSVNSTSGKLKLLGHESVRGDHPRHFNIDPTGQFLLVANANTDTIVVFKIDRETGTLQFTGNELKVPHPTCIQFV